MTKLVAIIGGVLLLAGVVLAGTLTGLGSAGTPTLGSTLAPATVSVPHQTTTRGHEAERRIERRHEARSVRGEREDGHHRGQESGRHGGHGGDD